MKRYFKQLDVANIGELHRPTKKVHGNDKPAVVQEVRLSPANEDKAVLGLREAAQAAGIGQRPRGLPAAQEQLSSERNPLAPQTQQGNSIDSIPLGTSFDSHKASFDSPSFDVSVRPLNESRHHKHCKV